jgi:hypothetical protein
LIQPNLFEEQWLNKNSSEFCAYTQGAVWKVSADQVTDETIQLMRQKISSDRKKAVAANLPPTEAESFRFWPVYDRYVVDQSKIYDTRYALIGEYAQN